MRKIHYLLSQLIERYEYELAAVAWEGYLKKSRGFILSCVEQQPENPGYFDLSYDYLASSDSYIDLIGEYSIEELALLRRAMNSYDPTEDFICVLFLRNGIEYEGVIKTHSPNTTPVAAAAALFTKTPSNYCSEWMD